jgi:hypothetical protein
MPRARTKQVVEVLPSGVVLVEPVYGEFRPVPNEVLTGMDFGSRSSSVWYTVVLRPYVVPMRVPKLAPPKEQG